MSAVKNVMKGHIRNAELDEFLEKHLAHAGYGGVDVTKTPMGTTITLYVARPGLVIGRRGMGIKDLTELIEKRFGLPNPQISVNEVQTPELNPRVMCYRIASAIMRGTTFRRAALWALNSIMNAGAMGAEVIISGKLRSERARYDKYRAGILPKSGEPAETVTREATTDVLLKMGLYGIKVRIALKEALEPEFSLREGEGPKEREEKEVGGIASTEGPGVTQAG